MHTDDFENDNDIKEKQDVPVHNEEEQGIYKSFYSYQDPEISNGDDKNRKWKIISIVCLLIIVLVAIILLVVSCSHNSNNNSNNSTDNGTDKPVEVPEPPKEVVLSLNVTKLNMRVGDKDTINVTIENGVSGSTITWNSADSSVVSVDNDGNLEAKKAGTTTVVATYFDAINNQKKEASCTVIVAKKTTSSTTTTDKTKPTCTLSVNETGEISASCSDSSGIKYQGFSSSYSGTNEKTKTVTKAGTYTYYAVDKKGNKASFTIKVSTKTQTRKQECSSCKTCSAAGCAWQAEYWQPDGSKSTVSGSCNTPPNSNENRNCKATGSIGSDRCSYSCDHYIYVKGECMAYNASCDKCGCSTWGSFGSWSDSTCTANSSVKCESRTLYYKG